MPDVLELGHRTRHPQLLSTGVDSWANLTIVNPLEREGGIEYLDPDPGLD